MYSRAYTAEQFHTSTRVDLASAEYFAFEEQSAARKEAKTQARPIRANFKGQLVL